jgi:hypothetical protein
MFRIYAGTCRDAGGKRRADDPAIFGRAGPGGGREGAVSLDGRLIDYASIRQAQVLVEKALRIAGVGSIN